MLNNNRAVKWLWLSALVIVLDQVSKHLILGSFELGQFVPVLPVLNLTLVFNKGAAFGFLNISSDWQVWVFGAIAVVVSGVILSILIRSKNYSRSLAIGLSLILGGALGNLIDRIVHGHVIDFIDFHVGTWHWPSFNIADSAIFIGAAILILFSFRK